MLGQCSHLYSILYLTCLYKFDAHRANGAYNIDKLGLEAEGNLSVWMLSLSPPPECVLYRFQRTMTLKVALAVLMLSLSFVISGSAAATTTEDSGTRARVQELFVRLVSFLCDYYSVHFVCILALSQYIRTYAAQPSA